MTVAVLKRTKQLALALIALLVASHVAHAAARCAVTGEVKRCENSFGPGTFVSFGDASGDVNRLVIDVPDTSVDAQKLLIFVGLTMMKFSPKLTADERGEAFKKLLVLGASDSKEQLRIGDWNWQPHL
jgi:hypothetical protein